MSEVLLVPHPLLRQKSKALNRVTKEDIEAELEKLCVDKDIDISSENVNIEIKITN